MISLVTWSTRFSGAVTNWATCSFTIRSKAMSGVNNPVRTPRMFWITILISFRKCFSSIFRSATKIFRTLIGMLHLWKHSWIFMLNLTNMKWKTLVKKSVDFGSNSELVSRDHAASGALDYFRKVVCKLINHLKHRLRLSTWIIWLEVLRAEIYIIFWY